MKNYNKLISLFLTISVLSGCQHNRVNTVNNNSMGPEHHCPTDTTKKYFYKSTNHLEKYQDCFSDDIGELVASEQLFSKIEWLIKLKEYQAAESLLLEAMDSIGHTQELQTKLTHLYIRQKRWEQALAVIDQAQIPVNDPLRVLVEIRTGQLSEGTNYDLLPQTYKNHINNQPALKANIFTDETTSFDLTRVDIADPGIQAGETSMRVSEDGQDIVVTWTDNAGEYNSDFLENSWQLQSAHSNDGGQTWTNQFISPLSQVENVHHFDPMTAYDPVNKLMYFGGMTTFLGPENNTFYVYRRNLENDAQQGPYFVNGSFDKGWMAVDDDGSLVMVENTQGAFSSMDFGESFFPLLNINELFTPQPRFFGECFYIADTVVMYKSCNDQPLTTIDAPFSAAALNLFINDQLIPGYFRLVPLRLLAVHPDGDLFIIYVDSTILDGTDYAVWMSRSGDNGETWDTPWIITPDIQADQLLPWIEIDQQGGIHVSYLDTRNGDQTDDSLEAHLDMYYSYSSDKGMTWHESRVTPTSLFVESDYWGNNYFFSDYLEMSVGNPEAVFLSFPWSPEPDATDLDMYVAKKVLSDLIFEDNFE